MLQIMRFLFDAYESRLHFVSGFSFYWHFAFPRILLIATIGYFGHIVSFPPHVGGMVFSAHGRLLRPLRFCPGLFSHFSIAYFSPSYLVTVG